MGIFILHKVPKGKVLVEIANRHGRTPRQVTLNFLSLYSNIFTIPKTSYPEREERIARVLMMEIGN